MRLFWAALAAAACYLASPVNAQDNRRLSLQDAYGRLMAQHPDLVRFAYLHDAAQASADEAAQGPPLTTSLAAENLGSGGRSGLDQTEITLSLASVLERGGKRAARQSVAAANLQRVGLDEQAKRLDLLAEVARRYLDLLAAQSLVSINEVSVGQRQRAVSAAGQRVRAGASPESVRLAAEAELARSSLRQQQASNDARACARRLAAMWGNRPPDFEQVTGDLLVLPRVPSLESLEALLERSPELRRFAGESRLREARLQLAQSAGRTDIQWQLGLRRLQESRDWAAVVGFSVPLGWARRAAPGIRAAQADLSALDLERQAQQLTLYAVLADAQARLESSSAEAAMARDEVVPRLQQASSAAERAYRGGALSYLEWSQLQAETVEARREALQAAVQAHRALIEIQRLTGESFQSDVPAFSEHTP